jgi:hypothetical protein
MYGESARTAALLAPPPGLGPSYAAFRPSSAPQAHRVPYHSPPEFPAYS